MRYNENTNLFEDLGLNDLMTPGEGYWVYITSKDLVSC